MTLPSRGSRPALRLVPRASSVPPPPPSHQPAPPKSGGGPQAAAFDDAQLLASIREGDESAAGALCARMRPAIFRTLHRLLGPGDSELEDLAQHALIELVTTIDRFRGDCSLDTWGSRTTAHVVYNEIRSRKVKRKFFEPATLDGDMEIPNARVRDSHANEVDAARLLEKLKGQLGEMDPAKALAYFLHDVCGYDLKEVAQITETSVSAAQTRLVRGRRELHERIAADPELSFGLRNLEAQG